MKINDETIIVKQIITDVRTGEKIEMDEKLGSKCFFKPIFQHKQYHIQLRLDYSPRGIDKFGNPMLDADIWEEKNGEKIPLPLDEKWHHTPSEIDPNLQRFVYRLRFNDLELDLISNKTVQKNLRSESVVIRDNLEIKLNKKPVL
jgi:hypothetical protein